MAHLSSGIASVDILQYCIAAMERQESPAASAPLQLRL
jgi:hypothetical protein